jgi:DNA repair protein RadC
LIKKERLFYTENINMKRKSIKEWAADDRPREKLIKNGSNSLSLSELLAILIQNGSKEKSALQLAQEILGYSKNNLDDLARMSLKDLQKTKGIGIAKAVIIEAAMELGRRRETTFIQENPILNTSIKAATLVRSILKDEAVEKTIAIYLSNSSKYLDHQLISIGGLTQAVVDTRIILKRCLEVNATKIIFAHNHPSGSLEPSNADLLITKRLNEVCKLMSINFVDHIIVSTNGYYSFADNGML